MVHLWVRAENRANEERTGLTPDGAALLISKGITVTVEDSLARIYPIADYAKAGALIASEGSWPDAPRQAVIFGLGPLPDDQTQLPHRHLMFSGDCSPLRLLLQRFHRGGGQLFDLAKLPDQSGKPMPGFGYWAGYAGAGVALLAWAASWQGHDCPPLGTWPSRQHLITQLRELLQGAKAPRTLVTRSTGPMGCGALDLCHDMNLPVTAWTLGSPAPNVLSSELLLDCIPAGPDAPVLLIAGALQSSRALRVIGDIACNPKKISSPVRLYDCGRGWDQPVIHLALNPVLDVTAIEEPAALLPRESSDDYAAQLLPLLCDLPRINHGNWGRQAFIPAEPSKK